MKKKGFTLVELLAVIAILAILVIVAMPNVLSMFNQAKQNTFMTEVKKIMDTATAEFTQDALTNNSETIYYSSEPNATLGTTKLDISGNDKNYFIEIDRYGDFKRVVVYDSNYCYDIYTSGSKGKYNASKSKLIFDKISKTTVSFSDIWVSGVDSIGVTIDGTNYVVKGCEGITTVEGKNDVLNIETAKISNNIIEFIPKMTWEEWINSSYNIQNLETNRSDIVQNEYFSHDPNFIINPNTNYYLSYSLLDYDNCPECDSYDSNIIVSKNDEILKDVVYYWTNYKNPENNFEIPDGEKYFFDYPGFGNVKYDTDIRVWEE